MTACAVPVTENTPVVASILLSSVAALGSLSTPLALVEGVTMRVSVGAPTLVSTIASPAKGSTGACPEVDCVAGDATETVGGASAVIVTEPSRCVSRRTGSRRASS